MFNREKFLRRFANELKIEHKNLALEELHKILTPYFSKPIYKKYSKKFRENREKILEKYLKNKGPKERKMLKRLIENYKDRLLIKEHFEKMQPELKTEIEELRLINIKRKMSGYEILLAELTKFYQLNSPQMGAALKIAEEIEYKQYWGEHYLDLLELGKRICKTSMTNITTILKMNEINELKSKNKLIQILQENYNNWEKFLNFFSQFEIY